LIAATLELPAVKSLTSLKHWLRPTFGRSLLFWNPLISGSVTFVFSGTQSFLPSWLISLTIANACMVQCYVAVALFVRGERAYYERRARPVPKHTIGWMFLGSALVMPFSFPLGYAAGGLVAHLLGVEWGAASFRSYRIGLGFGLVIIALFFFQRTRSEAREAARAAEDRIRDLENARLQAQLAALTAEMNPHLLFNALNTVASLIHGDPDRAEEVVLQLSALYRGVLRSSGSATHSLHDEVRLCEAYLQVERARFGERLEVSVDVEDAGDTAQIQVPVLILQPFVENAIKHGFSHRARGGSVRLEVRRSGDRIDARVEDDGVGFGHSPEAGAGKAIANCRERLALTYGEKAQLEVGPRAGGGTCVTVSFPAIMAG
jgi:two-component sensor histidine kinase